MTTQELTPPEVVKPTPQGRPVGDQDPPTFRQVVAELGWPETTDVINACDAWNADAQGDEK